MSIIHESIAKKPKKVFEKFYLKAIAEGGQYPIAIEGLENLIFQMLQLMGKCLQYGGNSSFDHWGGNALLGCLIDQEFKLLIYVHVFASVCQTM